MVQGATATQKQQNEPIGELDSTAVSESELSEAMSPLASSDASLSPETAISTIDSILELNKASDPPFLTSDQVKDLKETKKLLGDDSFVAQLAGFEKLFSTLSNVELPQTADNMSDSNESISLSDLTSDFQLKAASYGDLKNRTISVFSNEVLTQALTLPTVSDQMAFLTENAYIVADLYGDLEAAGLNLEGTAIETFVADFQSGSLDSVSDLSDALSTLQIDGAEEINTAKSDLGEQGVDVSLMEDSTEQAMLHQDVKKQLSIDPKSINSAVELSNDLIGSNDLTGLKPEDVEKMQKEVDDALSDRYKDLDLPKNSDTWTDSQRFLAENDPTIVYLTMTQFSLNDLLAAAQEGGSVSSVEAFKAKQVFLVSSATTLGNASSKMLFYVDAQDPAYVNVHKLKDEQAGRVESLKNFNAQMAPKIMSS